MMFALGVIVGLLIAVLIVIALTFFRSKIEHVATIAQKQIEIHGPRPKGFIFEPGDESDEVREELIESNQRQGKDTRIEDLQ